MSAPSAGNVVVLAQVQASLGGKTDFVVSATHSAILIGFAGFPMPRACY